MLSDSLPADALTKLQAVNNSGNFKRPDYAKYGLLLTRTMLMTGNRIPSDSLVSLAIAYYRETNNSTALFDALYTKAMFLFSSSRYDSAVYYFAAAENVIPPGVESTQTHPYATHVRLCELISWSYESSHKELPYSTRPS